MVVIKTQFHQQKNKNNIIEFYITFYITFYKSILDGSSISIVIIKEFSSEQT